MNIALFTPSQNPYSETFIQAHKNYLKGDIFYYYGRRNIQLEGHPPLANKWQRRFLSLQKRLLKKPSNFIDKTLLINSLKQHKIDVVLAEYGSHAHFILDYVRKAGLPLVVHFHGYDASVREVIEKHNNYHDVFQYATKVIAVSRKMENVLLEMGCPKEKLVYNVYGPQPEFLEVTPTFAKKQFIAIGRFADKKAPYYTILAFHNAVKNHPDAKLLMAGAGALLNTCKNLVKHLKIEDQVVFLGIISPEKYREFLSESLGFVQHSITAENGDMEGTPLAVLEASAAGLPVISTTHAGIPDVIIHRETGLLCQEHHVETMANDMILLLDEMAVGKKMGRQGKKNIQENFNLERHITSLQTILEEACGYNS